MEQSKGKSGKGCGMQERTGETGSAADAEGRNFKGGGNKLPGCFPYPAAPGVLACA